MVRRWGVLLAIASILGVGLALFPTLIKRDPTRGVFDLAVANNGAVWAVSDHGIAHFDGQEWAIVTDIGFAGITVAPDGIVWAYTDAQVSRFDGTTWQSLTPNLDLHRRKICNLKVSTDNILWVLFCGYDDDSGLIKFDGHVWTFAPPIPEKFVRGIKGYHLLGLDQRGRPWVTNWAGTFYLDEDQWVGTSDWINEVAFGTDGSRWATEWGSVFFHPDPPASPISIMQSITVASLCYQSPGGNQECYPLAPTLDNDPNTNPAIKRGAKALTSTVLITPEITSLTIAPDNTLWLATTNYIDTDTSNSTPIPKYVSTLIHFDGRTWQTCQLRPNFPYIRKLKVAPDNSIWVITASSVERLSASVIHCN